MYHVEYRDTSGSSKWHTHGSYDDRADAVKSAKKLREHGTFYKQVRVRKDSKSRRGFDQMYDERSRGPRPR